MTLDASWMVVSRLAVWAVAAPLFASRATFVVRLAEPLGEAPPDAAQDEPGLVRRAVPDVWALPTAARAIVDPRAAELAGIAALPAASATLVVRLAVPLGLAPVVATRPFATVSPAEPPVLAEPRAAKPITLVNRAVPLGLAVAAAPHEAEPAVRLAVLDGEA